MARRRSRQSSNPADKLMRRMNMYQSEFWVILEHARQGKDYQRTFGTHNETNAFISRYYKFRMDAVEAKVPGALEMRDMQTTGRDVEGNAFNTRRHEQQGPFTVTWHYQGEEGQGGQAKVEEGQATPPRVILPPPATTPQRDAAEELIARYYGLKKTGDKGVVPSVTSCPPCEPGQHGVCLKCGRLT